MRSLVATLLITVGLAVSSSAIAQAARVNVRIDLSSQTMMVTQDGVPRSTWPVSTGRPGYRTPVGVFKPVRLARTWYSRKYDYAPMPYSVFFYGGYAIHGTTQVRSLGRPASHGCIRLHPDNARVLFNLILRYGRAATTITIQR